jgi:hypothetical protein
MRFDITWAVFKAVHARKQLAKSRVQYACTENSHDVAFADGQFVFYTKLLKGTPDAEEFESQWMSEANGASC